MKSILFLLILFLSINLFSQELAEVKQITTVDGDARNVTCQTGNFGNNPPIFFEVHKNGFSNIYRLINDLWGTEEWDNLTRITNDSCLNINPVCQNNFLFYQTNKNGNWDIAFKILKDTIWSETKYLANSQEDEIQPTLLLNGSFNYDDTLKILFLKNNSVYLSSYSDSGFVNKLIFESGDSIIYEQPTGIIYSNYGVSGPLSGTYLAAKKTNLIDSTVQIVYKYKNDSKTFGEKNIIIQDKSCNNPKFLSTGWASDLLTFVKRDGNFNNIFLMYDWVNTKDSNRLKDTIIGDLSELRTTKLLSITKRNLLFKQSDFNLWYSHTYKYLINDSLFISTNKYLNISPAYNYVDTFIYTRVKNSSLALAGLSDGYDCYSIWEDSADGHIQLFASESFNDFSDVNDPQIPTIFTLYQNYPNPFNPTTTIRFYNPHSSYLKLKVYNVLGEEVKRLVDGFTNSGMHEIKFNAANLPSGIYFYQIEGENFKQVKKMILLK